MQELKMIKNELVPVYTTYTGEKVVYGTELHAALKVKTPYRIWADRRFDECEAIEKEDFEAVQICTPSGQSMKENIIKLDIAKEMAMLERNEIGKKVRKYFISVEKKYSQNINTQELSPELQMFNRLFQSLASQELKQKEQEKKLKELEEQSQKILGQVESIREVLAINSKTWREETDKILKRIAWSLGGCNYYGDIRTESYELLERRMGVDLNIRLINKRRKMAEDGVCKSKREKKGYVDVIAEDKKLIEGYLAIVKEMAIRYKVA